MSTRKVDGETLRKLKRLSSLPPKTLDKLATNLDVTLVKRKTRLFEQGEQADYLYILLKGIVKLSWVNHLYHRVLVTPLARGEFFGVGTLFPHRYHPYRCETATDCTIGAIAPEKAVEALMNISLETYLQGNEILTSRVWTSYSRCIRGMGTPLRKRLALELLELGASFGVQDSRGVILAIKTTHEDLADSIGFSRQKVTETLSDFEAQGAIKRDGRRLILKTEKLQELLEQG